MFRMCWYLVFIQVDTLYRHRWQLLRAIHQRATTGHCLLAKRHIRLALLISLLIPQLVMGWSVEHKGIVIEKGIATEQTRRNVN